MNGSAFEKIGIFSVIENFVFFLVLGCVVILFGNLFYDLSSDLPEGYLVFLQEPVAILCFFVMSIVGLIVIGFATKFGTVNLNDKWWFDRILMVPCRVGIGSGAIASGMILGIGLGLIALSEFSGNDQFDKDGRLFLALGISFLGMVYPVMVLMLYLINHDRQYALNIEALAGIYVLFVIYLLIKNGWHLDTSLALGVCFSLFISYVIWIRRFF